MFTALAALLMLFGVSLLAAPAASAAVPISGYVTCIDQLNVEGVWVAASSGGSGYASWQSTGGYQAHFSYSLPYGGRWTVHVGCGGSPSSWRYPVNGNTTTANTYQSWTCYPADIVQYPFCQLG